MSYEWVTYSGSVWMEEKQKESDTNGEKTCFPKKNSRTKFKKFLL